MSGGSKKDPPDKTEPSPIEQGVDKHLADRSRKAAAKSDEEFDAGVARSVKVAVAAAEGDTAVVKEARS